MNKQSNKVKWFLISFLPCFGGYLAQHFDNPDDLYAVTDFLAALAAVPVLVIAWAISRKYNRALGQGFIWSLAAIFIFLFTFGGCSLLRL